MYSDHWFQTLKVLLKVIFKNMLAKYIRTLAPTGCASVPWDITVSSLTELLWGILSFGRSMVMLDICWDRRCHSIALCSFAGAVLEGAEFLVITMVQSKYCVKVIVEREIRVFLSVLYLTLD